MKRTKTKPGSSWRILAYNKTGSGRIAVEQTPKEKPAIEIGTGPFIFDELVIDDWFHLEQMDDDYWWMRVGDKTINVTIKNGKPSVMVEDYG